MIIVYFNSWCNNIFHISSIQNSKYVILIFWGILSSKYERGTSINDTIGNIELLQLLAGGEEHVLFA